jgi:hypothetical protein
VHDSWSAVGWQGTDEVVVRDIHRVTNNVISSKATKKIFQEIDGKSEKNKKFVRNFRPKIVKNQETSEGLTGYSKFL